MIVVFSSWFIGRLGDCLDGWRYGSRSEFRPELAASLVPLDITETLSAEAAFPHALFRDWLGFKVFILLGSLFQAMDPFEVPPLLVTPWKSTRPAVGKVAEMSTLTAWVRPVSSSWPQRR